MRKTVGIIGCGNMGSVLLSTGVPKIVYDISARHLKSVTERYNVQSACSNKDLVDRLKPLLREEVELKGILKSKEGKRIIKVEKFSKLGDTDYHRN